MTMAYILVVNPNILGSVMDRNGVFLATALSSAFATFVMAFLANYPIALSAGLGLNAYFAYTVCMGELKGVENAYTIALTAVLVEGLIFVLLSVLKIREYIINGIPISLKNGITAGIGLFIAFIGLQNANIIVKSDSTTVALGDVGSPQVALALIGFFILLVLEHYNVKAAVLISILVTWVMGMIAQIAGWYVPDPANGVASLFPQFTGILDFSGLSKTAFHFNFAWIGGHLIEFIAITFSLLYVDFFDTVGLIVGIADRMGIEDENGNIPRASRVLLSDAIGTVVGACLSTSTITSFIESSAGVESGGRTGLTSVVTGVLFLVSLVLSPIFLAIPSFATAPALIYVGMLLFSTVRKIDLDGDMADRAAAFVAILMMPLAYSISTGIMLGIIVWVLMKTAERKASEVNPIMWIIFALFVLRIISLVV